MVAWLSEIIDPVPAIFSTVAKGRLLRPIKIGIHKDLALRLRPRVDPKRLKVWLGNWCGSVSYLEAMAAERAWRVNLELQPVEPVSEEDRQKALERLLELRKEAAEKIAAARDRADPIAGLCLDCWTAKSDLEGGVCADCRAAAADHHDEVTARQGARQSGAAQHRSATR
jgi:sRNA-binding protein